VVKDFEDAIRSGGGWFEVTSGFTTSVHAS
jgi:hypothetical protein